MTTMGTPLMYVVTALISIEDAFSPQIVGVYTSQELAINNARSFFEKHSLTYRNGAFDTKTDEDVIGQEDFSSDLVLSSSSSDSSPCRRVFLEVYPEYYEQKTVVAINVLRCNERVSQRVPLICRESGRRNQQPNDDDGKTVQDEATSTEIFIDKCEGRNKVFLLMSADAAVEDSDDPTLLGVFFEKDDAIKAATVIFDEEKKFMKDCHYNITDSTDNTGSIGERGELLSFEDTDGFYYGIAMDTFILDDDFAEKQLPFSRAIYHGPEIRDFEETECKRQCISCKVEKSTRYYCTLEWKKQGEDRACKDCLPEMTKMCCNCKVEKKYGCFLRYEWDSEAKDRACNVCLPEMTKQCSHCKAEKKYKCYGREDWTKGPGPLLCQACKEEINSKTCSVCNVKKNQASFHQHEYMRKSDQQRTCKDCGKTKTKKSDFSKQQRGKPDQDRQCITSTANRAACSEKKDKVPQATATTQSTPLPLLPNKRSVPVTNEKDDKNSNKKPKLLTKQCQSCGKGKIRDDFSKSQWRKSTRRCKMCIENRVSI